MLTSAEYEQELPSHLLASLEVCKVLAQLVCKGERHRQVQRTEAGVLLQLRVHHVLGIEGLHVAPFARLLLVDLKPGCTQILATIRKSLPNYEE